MVSMDATVGAYSFHRFTEETDIATFIVTYTTVPTAAHLDNWASNLATSPMIMPCQIFFKSLFSNANLSIVNFPA